jgi:hypothetical protein
MSPIRVRSFFPLDLKLEKNSIEDTMDSIFCVPVSIATISIGKFTFMYFEDNDDDDDLNAADQLIALFLGIHEPPVAENTSPLGGNKYYNYLMNIASDHAFF